MIIIPVRNDTRLRADHTTYADVVSTCNAGSIVEGDDVWVALADGDQVKKDDKWLRVTKINGTLASGWMAIVHNGAVISKAQDDPNLPPPPPKPVVIKILKAVVTYSEDGVIKTETLVPE